MIKIYIASDHAGYTAKNEIISILKKQYNIEDLGPNTDEIKVNYPKFAKKVCNEILKKHYNKTEKLQEFGILICGTGTGMCIAANKINNIRASFSYDEYSAIMSRNDNNANVLCLRSREFNHKKYKKIIKAFLETNFSEKPRHIKRINELKNIENIN